MMKDEGCWILDNGCWRMEENEAVAEARCSAVHVRAWIGHGRHGSESVVQCRLGAARRQGLALSGLACIFN
jgi:hypothetical protein